MPATKPAPLTLAALAAVLALAGCASGSTDTGGAPETAHSPGLPSHSELRAAIDRALDGSGVPGGAAIVTGPGAEQTLVLFGEADLGGDAARGEPGGETREVADETRFAYRSITKSFTGTVILQLVDEGKMSLDDPISHYVDGVPGGSEITIAELGAMRSGLANYSSTPGLGALLSADPEREPSADELLDLAYPESPVFAPGDAYEYSNTNTLLLGAAIERVTGKSWFEAVRQRILDPLRLDSVAYGFGAAGDDAEAVDARGFQLADDRTAERLPQVAPGWFGAAGALTGDVEDLATWGRALGDGRLLSAEAQRERVSLLGPIAADPHSPEYDRYGFAMGEIAGWLGHTGTGLGFQALTMHDPGSGRTVAILINGTGDDPDLPAHMFRQILEVLPTA